MRGRRDTFFAAAAVTAVACASVSEHTEPAAERGAPDRQGTLPNAVDEDAHPSDADASIADAWVDAGDADARVRPPRDAARVDCGDAGGTPVALACTGLFSDWQTLDLGPGVI